MSIRHKNQLDFPAIALTDKIDEGLLRQFAEQRIHPVEQFYQIWREGAKHMMPHYTIAKVCLCMLAGEQWLNWDARSGIVQRLADTINWAKPNVVYAVMDRIKPAYRFKLGQLTDELHVPEVVPAGERPDQFANARMQTQYAQALWWSEMLDDVHEEAMAWILSTGEAYLKPFWDAKRQRGSARCLSIFELMLMPYGIKHVKQADVALETQATSVERIRDEYPKTMDDFDSTELTEDYSMVLASTDTFLTSIGATRTIRNMMPVRDIIRRPTKDFPQGYHMRMSRQRLLELEPLKHSDMPMPFYQLTYDRFPGALHPPGMIQGEIAKQFYYNKLFSDIIAYIHGQGIGAKLMLPDSLEIKDRDLYAVNKPVRYQDDMNNIENKPYYLARPNLPNDTFGVREWLINDFDDSVSWHQVNRGQAPPNIESGIGVQALQARDDQPVTPLRKKTGRQWARCYSHIMTLTNREWKGGKPLVGVDPMFGMPFAVENFRKNKTNEPLLVYMRTVPNTPTDQIANRQMMLEMLQYGAFDDISPQEKRDIVKYGIQPSLFSPKNMHRLVARRENNRMLSGELNAENIDGSVKSYHDDYVHLEEHLDFANHPDLEGKPVDVREAVMAHIGVHQTNLALVRQQQMRELGMAGKGRGGEAPAGQSAESTGEGAVPPQAGAMGGG